MNESISPMSILNLNHIRLELFLPIYNRWYDFYDHTEYVNKGDNVKVKISNRKIGVFIKGGSIFPMKMRVRRSAKLMQYEPITLIVALTDQQMATGLVYFDDEESFDYAENKKYFLKKFMFQSDELFIANMHQEFKISNVIERIVILGLNEKVKRIYFKTFSSDRLKDLEFSQDSSKVEIKRLKLFMDYLWKIKLEYDLDN